MLPVDRSVLRLAEVALAPPRQARGSRAENSQPECLAPFRRLVRSGVCFPGWGGDWCNVRCDLLFRGRPPFGGGLRFCLSGGGAHNRWGLAVLPFRAEIFTVPSSDFHGNPLSLRNGFPGAERVRIRCAARADVVVRPKAARHRRSVLHRLSEIASAPAGQLPGSMRPPCGKRRSRAADCNGWIQIA